MINSEDRSKDFKKFFLDLTSLTDIPRLNNKQLIRTMDDLFSVDRTVLASPNDTGSYYQKMYDVVLKELERRPWYKRVFSF